MCFLFLSSPATLLPSLMAARWHAFSQTIMATARWRVTCQRALKAPFHRAQSVSRFSCFNNHAGAISVRDYCFDWSRDAFTFRSATTRSNGRRDSALCRGSDPVLHPRESLIENEHVVPMVRTSRWRGPVSKTEKKTRQRETTTTPTGKETGAKFDSNLAPITRNARLKCYEIKTAQTKDRETRLFRRTPARTVRHILDAQAASRKAI